jgi:hypothetical protein
MTGDRQAIESTGAVRMIPRIVRINIPIARMLRVIEANSLPTGSFRAVPWHALPDGLLSRAWLA